MVMDIRVGIRINGIGSTQCRWVGQRPWAARIWVKGAWDLQNVGSMDWLSIALGWHALPPNGITLNGTAGK